MFKRNDIVVSELTQEDVGAYFEKYDLHIVAQMLEVGIGAVQWLDSDGAVYLDHKSYGAYAFPPTRLRMATEEEKEIYELDRYKVKLKLMNGESYDLPLDDVKYLQAKDIRLDLADQPPMSIIHNLGDIHKAVSIQTIETIIVLILDSCNTNAIYELGYKIGKHFSDVNKKEIKLTDEEKELEQRFLKYIFNTAFMPKFYENIEQYYELPVSKNDPVYKIGGHLFKAKIREMNLYDYLHRNNWRFDSSFVSLAKIEDKDLDDVVSSFRLGRQDKTRLFRYLDLTIDQINYVLTNPDRDFEFPLVNYFARLDWEDIISHQRLFRKALTDAHYLNDRVLKGKYIAPEYIEYFLNGIVCPWGEDADEEYTFYNFQNKPKNTLKVKDILAYLSEE
jgi:hypothetical protein